MIVRKVLRRFIRWVMKPDKVVWGELGENSRVQEPFLHDENTHLVRIGNNTQILRNSRIQLFPLLVDEIPHITIGNGCYIGFNVTLLAGADIVIEDKVLMASNIIISSENHTFNPENEIPYMDQPLSAAPVRISEGCWIGEKVSILPGVTIGKRCVIGAASVVTKSIPDYCVAVGTPVRVVKRYDFEKHEWKSV